MAHCHSVNEKALLWDVVVNIGDKSFLAPNNTVVKCLSVGSTCD